MGIVSLKIYNINTKINNGLANTLYEALDRFMWRTTPKPNLGWIVEFVFVVYLLHKRQNQK